MSELAKLVDNGNKFALPVKALFTGKLGKPVLPVFTSFYRYKFTTLNTRDKLYGQRGGKGSDNTKFLRTSFLWKPQREKERQLDGG